MLWEVLYLNVIQCGVPVWMWLKKKTTNVILHIFLLILCTGCIVD